MAANAAAARQRAAAAAEGDAAAADAALTADQMQRYVRWYREGYLSSNGDCFDIGGTCRQALHAFENSGEPMSGSTFW